MIGGPIKIRAHFNGGKENGCRTKPCWGDPGQVAEAIRTIRKKQADLAAEKAAKKKKRTEEEVHQIQHKGKLTVHVIDSARGCPAAGMPVMLKRNGLELRRGITGEDGRWQGKSLLQGMAMLAGVYDLVFFAGEYFEKTNQPTTEPKFFDEIVIRVGVSDPQRHYHVPLVLSPYGYSTYRGSTE
jgi:5-hydroxyisourate hydrolase